MNLIDLHTESGQTLQGSFSAVSKPNFATKYALESSRRDLHNALLCTAKVSPANPAALLYGIGIREVPPRSPATTGAASSPLDKQAKIDKRLRERFRLDGTVEYVDSAAPEVSSASAGLTSRRTVRKLFQLFRPKVDNAFKICQN